jgi:nicotinic acid mononucleotide adenylyltransferase
VPLPAPLGPSIVKTGVPIITTTPNSNLIGYFHQNIFNYLGHNWFVPSKGYDIECPKKKIYVEMKNKHNTMNSSSGAKTYLRMLNTLIKDNNSICLLVEVIAKKSQNIPWIITLDGIKQQTNPNIRRVSIDKFYEIVTGDKLAFKKLCEVIPTVIEDVVFEIKKKEKENTVFKELNEISDDTLKSIFLLAFKKYEGFNNFKIKK